MTHISRFNAWARAAGLALLMCAVPLAAPAQEPVGRKGDRSVAEQKMDSALIDLTRAAGSGQLCQPKIEMSPFSPNRDVPFGESLKG